MKRPRSPFDILEVSPSDDLTTIRLAWRAKVRRLHPDRAQNAALATAELAEVNAAFDALKGHKPVRSGSRPEAAPVRRGRKGPAAKGQVGNERRSGREGGDPAPKEAAPAGGVLHRTAASRPVAREDSARAIRGYAAARPFIAAA